MSDRRALPQDIVTGCPKTAMQISSLKVALIMGSRATCQASVMGSSKQPVNRRSDSQQLLRQWAVLRLLSETASALSTKQIADKLGVAKSKIERDLAALKTLFPIAVESSGKQKKLYRLDQRLRELEAVAFGVGELLAIYMALASLASFAGTPIHDDLDRVRLKIRGALGPGNQSGLDAFPRVFARHARGFVDYSGHGENIDELADAIARRRVCKITYHVPSKGTTRTHRIQPLRLVWYRSSLYLFACFGDRPKIVTFAVHRIRDLEKTDSVFDPPQKIDVDEEISKAFGIFVGDLLEEVEVLFDAEIAWYVEERTFHPDEKKHRLPDGRLVYRVLSSAQWEIIPWVRSFGALAELVAPRVWRDVLHASLEAAAARYRPAGSPG